MSKNLEDMKKKREQLDARIAQAEARLRAQTSKEETTVKVLVGAAILNHLKNAESSEKTRIWLLKILGTFLTRDRDIRAVLGENAAGSDAFKRLTERLKPDDDKPAEAACAVKV